MIRRPSIAGLAVAIAFMAVSATPMAHVLAEGLRPVDSYNSVWIDSFSASLARGEWRPRWVPEAFDGMGASTFYFYPPLFFYVSGLVDALSAGRLSAELTAAWSGFALSVLSSATMYAWLRRRTGKVVSALGGAAYALAPYHLLDLFARGSLGELAAYPLMPLFAMAFERTVRDRDGVPYLALTYAGLILAHVAVGLTVSAFVIPVLTIYALVRAERRDIGPILLRLAVGGALGLGLAASYLAPALMLQDASSMKWMWGTTVDAANPANWTLFNRALWPSPTLAAGMAGLACLYALLAAAALAVTVRAKTDPAAVSRTWATVCVAAIIAYGVPQIWQGPMAPILGKVQFPFRMLVFMEFAVISAVALGGGLRSRAVLALAAVGLAAATPFVRELLAPNYALTQGYPDNADPVLAERIRHGRAPEEHLPAGFDFDPRIVLSRVYLDGFAALPPMRAVDPGARVLASSEYPDGSIAAEIDAPRPTLVLVRRFNFPAWRVDMVLPGPDKALTAVTEGPSRFVAFTAEPGRRMYRVHLVRTAQEKAADTVSALSLAAVIGLIAARRLRRWRPSPATAA